VKRSYQKCLVHFSQEISFRNINLFDHKTLKLAGKQWWLFSGIYLSSIAVHRLLICQSPDELQVCVLTQVTSFQSQVSEEEVIYLRNERA
jgi:hypothetical protein